MTTPPPTIGEFVAPLVRIAGTDVATDVPLGDLGVESLALVEWFYSVEDAYGVQFDVEVLDRLGRSTVAEVYEALLAIM